MILFLAHVCNSNDRSVLLNKIYILCSQKTKKKKKVSFLFIHQHVQNEFLLTFSLIFTNQLNLTTKDLEMFRLRSMHFILSFFSFK